MDGKSIPPQVPWPCVAPQSPFLAESRWLLPSPSRPVSAPPSRRSDSTGSEEAALYTMDAGHGGSTECPWTSDLDSSCAPGVSEKSCGGGSGKCGVSGSKGCTCIQNTTAEVDSGVVVATEPRARVHRDRRGHHRQHRVPVDVGPGLELRAGRLGEGVWRGLGEVPREREQGLHLRHRLHRHDGRWLPAVAAELLQFIFVETMGCCAAVSHGSSGHQRSRAGGASGSMLWPGLGDDDRVARPARPRARARWARSSRGRRG